MNIGPIAIILPSLQLGGAELQTVHQINLLLKKGQTVYLILLSQIADNNLLNKLQLKQENILILPNKGTTLTFSNIIKLAGAAQAKAFLKANSIQHVIAHMPLAHFFARGLKAKGATFNLIQYHHALEFEASPINSFTKRVFHKYNLQLAKRHDNQHWFASQPSAENYLAHFPIKTEIHILPNALNEEITPNSNAAKELLQNLPKSNFRILFPGRLHPAKGHVKFLEHFKTFLAQNPSENIQLIIAGYGNEEEKIKAYCQQNQLENNVFITGKLPHETLLGLYAQVQLTVIPSLSEGFGLVAIEALFQQSLLITSNAGGLNDIIQHQQNGFKFALQQYNDVVNLLQHAYIKHPCAEINREKAAQEAKEKYGMESQVSTIVNLLNQG